MEKGCLHTINETGSRLEALRKERGYSQKYVAQIVGVDVKNYAAWENGIKRKRDGGKTAAQPVELKGKHLAALADLYGVSVDFLLGRTSYKAIDGAAIAQLTGLSDQAISALEWYNEPGMNYHVSRDVSQLVTWVLQDFENQGGNSFLQTVKTYLQCAPSTAGYVTPNTGARFDALKTAQVDLNAVLLLQIVAALDRFKEYQNKPKE